MTLILGLLCGLFLAFANGANDNFKGVATLFGSKTVSYRGALVWATVTTALGSLAALVLAEALLTAFSGKGLVPDSVVGLPQFLLAVGAAAAVTVLLATRLGFPVSTTHSLIGGLVGAGLLASADGVDLHKLLNGFFLPLVVSPLLAIGGTILLYPLFRLTGSFFGIRKETCLCIGNEIIGVVPHGTEPQEALTLMQLPTVHVGTNVECREQYRGRVLGLEAAKALDFFHYLSAGIVSFARGLNDTPKIAAILLAGPALAPAYPVLFAAAAMALGGWLGARRVAETMSFRVTGMDHGQGFAANLMTGLLVLFASKWGMPVSTTHVSCGSLFGIGAVTHQVRWKTIASILTAWVITLPLAAILGGLFFWIFRGVA